MRNLNITASASIGGGEYDNINIYGAAKINGEIKASKIQVFGACNCLGTVTVEDLIVNGACTSHNEVKAQFLKVYGAIDFRGLVSRAKQINILGSVNTKTLESDKIIIQGAIKCEEQLNSDYIEITTDAHCYIKEMVGSKIIVKPRRKLFFKKFEKVEAEVIEGDEIEIENVSAKLVRGNIVKIGDGCEIEKVEYNEKFDLLGKSDVKSHEKI